MPNTRVIVPYGSDRQVSHIRAMLDADTWHFVLEQSSIEELGAPHQLGRSSQEKWGESLIIG